MLGRIVLVSGPIAAGKTTISNLLADRHQFRIVSTRELIKSASGEALHERLATQRAGDSLDRKTKGAWILRGLRDVPQDASIVVDALRAKLQIDEVRKAFGPRVTHVHLTASPDVLQARYEKRASAQGERTPYAAAKRNATERKVEQLAKEADVLINTERASPDDVLVRLASHLGLYGRGIERLVDVLVGGQYGSEGKGHVSSYLAPEYDVLLRVGGPNAGHKVYEGPGSARTFYHLPSGTLRAGRAQLILGPGAVLLLPRLIEEITAASVDVDRLAIDPQAMVVDPKDQSFEAQELVGSIGSTGQGVGAATARKVLRSAAAPPVLLARDADQLKPFLRPTAQVLEDAFARGKRVFLEGTQGTALSLHHGFYPYVTSRDTTASGCLADAGIPPTRVRKIIMVCRTYPIRVANPPHGTSGPMTAELTWADVANRSGLDVHELEEHEHSSTTHKLRRVCEFDWALFRKAASLNGPTDIALSFADYLSATNRRARRFEQLTPDTIRFVEEVERVAGAPVSLITTRFHFRSIIDRRAW
jgi:adenylosuccinate synthase